EMEPAGHAWLPRVLRRVRQHRAVLLGTPRVGKSVSMSNAFFDPSMHRGHAASALQFRRARGAVPAEVLSNASHAKQLAALQLACVDHRRMLFELGRKHGIKLHYGACLSMTEVLLTLYLHWLRVDPQ